MQDYRVGTSIQMPTDLLASPADRLRTGGRAGDSNHKQDVRKVAQEFESLFVAHLLKVMRETIEEAEQGENGMGKGIYTEMFDQEFARSISRQRGMGISELLVKGLREEAPAESPGTDPGRVDSNGAPIQLLTSSTLIPSPAVLKRPENAEVPDFRLPLKAPVSSNYGLRKDPFTHTPRFHKGLDLAAPAGVEVRAAKEGEVIFSGFQAGYGNTVVIQHSGGLQTRYAHLGSTGVRAGESIAAEQVVGIVGETGHATGPHLHFEVTRWGKNIDPLPAMASGASNIKGAADAPDSLTE